MILPAVVAVCSSIFRTAAAVLSYIVRTVVDACFCCFFLALAVWLCHFLLVVAIWSSLIRPAMVAMCSCIFWTVAAVPLLVVAVCCYIFRTVAAVFRLAVAALSYIFWLTLVAHFFIIFLLFVAVGLPVVAVWSLVIWPATVAVCSYIYWAVVARVLLRLLAGRRRRLLSAAGHVFLLLPGGGRRLVIHHLADGRSRYAYLAAGAVRGMPCGGLLLLPHPPLRGRRRRARVIWSHPRFPDRRHATRTAAAPASPLVSSGDQQA